MLELLSFGGTTMTCIACEQPFAELFPARLPREELHHGKPICPECAGFRARVETAQACGLKGKDRSKMLGEAEDDP